MIKVKFNGNSVVIRGHAGFDNYGKDIICAILSASTLAVVNDICAVNKDALEFKDNSKELTIKIVNEDKLCLKLLNNLKEIIKKMVHDYPDNIKIESED